MFGRVVDSGAEDPHEFAIFIFLYLPVTAPPIPPQTRCELHLGGPVVRLAICGQASNGACLGHPLSATFPPPHFLLPPSRPPPLTPLHAGEQMAVIFPVLWEFA